MTFGKVVGIYSSMPQQGKSEIRKRLVEKHGFRHLPFARILKRMLMTFLIESGYPEVSALEYVEEKKNEPLVRVAGMPTARYLLQTLGTDWGLNMVHPTIWTAEWENKARVWSRSGIGVVADDLRFGIEVEVIRRLGGSIWRVEKPDAEVTPEVLAHASEGNLSHLEFDRVIVNDGTLGELGKKVDIAISARPNLTLAAMDRMSGVENAEKVD